MELASLRIKHAPSLVLHHCPSEGMQRGHKPRLLWLLGSPVATEEEGWRVSEQAVAVVGNLRHRTLPNSNGQHCKVSTCSGAWSPPVPEELARAAPRSLRLSPSHTTFRVGNCKPASSLTLQVRLQLRCASSYRVTWSLNPSCSLILTKGTSLWLKGWINGSQAPSLRSPLKQM